jgi:hypothetical protein
MKNIELEKKVREVRYYLAFTETVVANPWKNYSTSGLPRKTYKLHSQSLDEAILEIRIDPCFRHSSFTIWKFPGARLVYAQ